MQQHNEFMRKVLTKFINYNEQRQHLYQKEKHQLEHKPPHNNHKRRFSEQKLHKNKDIKRHNPETSNRTMATHGSLQIEEEKPKKPTKQ